MGGGARCEYNRSELRNALNGGLNPNALVHWQMSDEWFVSLFYEWTRSVGFTPPGGSALGSITGRSQSNGQDWVSQRRRKSSVNGIWKFDMLTFHKSKPISQHLAWDIAYYLRAAPDVPGTFYSLFCFFLCTLLSCSLAATDGSVNQGRQALINCSEARWNEFCGTKWADVYFSEVRGKQWGAF